MIKFNSDIRLIGVDGSYTEEKDLVLSLYFNTKHTIISPKSVLDVLYMFNGFFNATDIVSTNFGHKDIEANKIIEAVFNYGIVSDLDIDKSSMENQELLSIAQSQMQEYTAHFPRLSNINIMIAVLLQKLRVKCVFYNDSAIGADDMYQNIYYQHDDIGKSVSLTLKEMGASNIYFEPFLFDKCKLSEDKIILVNSDSVNWVDSDKYIVINTWNYNKIHFEDFKLFNYKNIDVSDDLKPLIEGFILSTRSIEDMIYSIKGTITI
ncbi:hypothetical protein [Treponema sp. R80B11-R83G3]